MALSPGQQATTSSRLGAAILGCLRLNGTLPAQNKVRDDTGVRRTEWRENSEDTTTVWVPQP